MQSPDAARRIAESLVERGIAAGATAADALYAGDHSSGVQVRLGEIDSVSRSEGEQIGLRLFVGQSSATVASSGMFTVFEMAPDRNGWTAAIILRWPL